MGSVESKEIILARGHENVLGTHETTLEFTKETQLSNRGDCIIAVRANKGINDLSSEFKKMLRKDDARITIVVAAGGVSETINARGDPRLILAHPRDVVVRKSRYVCERTLAFRADKSASELSRELVEKLKNPDQRVKITLIVKANERSHQKRLATRTELSHGPFLKVVSCRLFFPTFVQLL